MVPGLIPVISSSGISLVNVISQSNSSADPQTINLPGNILDGDFLLISASVGATTTITWPGGYNQLITSTNSTRVILAYHRCDGSEGASISLDLSSAAATVALIHHLRGVHPTTPPEATETTSTSSGSTDPPVVNPSWGLAKNMFIAHSMHRVLGGPTSYPSGYGLGQITQDGSVSNTSAAARIAASASENPGVFSYAAGSVAWAAITTAIRPR